MLKNFDYKFTQITVYAINNGWLFQQVSGFGQANTNFL